MTSKLLLFIFLTKLCCPQIAAADVYEHSTFIRSDDALQFNLERFLNFNHLPVNFSSDSKSVKLPGVLSSEAVFEDQKIRIDPLVFKSKDDRVFVISKDGRTLNFLRVTEELKLEERDFPLSKALEKRTDLFCSDMNFDNGSFLFVLCSHWEGVKEAKPQARYVIFGVDYFSPADFAEVEFVSSAYEVPSIKVISSERSEGVSRLLLFDQHVESKTSKAKKSSFTLLDLKFTPPKYKESAHSNKIQEANKPPKGDREEEQIDILRVVAAVEKVKDAEFALIESRVIDLKEPLNLSKQTFDIQNLMISQIPELKLWGTLNLNNKFGLISYFNCKIVNSPELKDFSLENCSVDDKSIREFFLKEQEYIIVDSDGNLNFCSLEEGICGSGTIPKKWTLERILLEDRLGVVVMRIEDGLTVFIKDFRLKQFTWHKVNNLDAKHSFLIKAYSRSEKKNALVSVSPNGLQAFDISINHFLKVSKSDIVSSNLIDLKLENISIMKLNVKLYNSKEPIDTMPGQVFRVAKDRNGLFRLRLPVHGSNLNFVSQDGQRIMYFDPVVTNLNSISGKRYIFSNQEKYFVFEMNKAVMLTCRLDLSLGYAHSLVCSDEKKIELIGEIDPSSIKEISLYADILLVNFEKSEDLRLISINNLKELSPAKPENLAGGTHCKINMNLLLCKYAIEEPKKFHTIRGFKIKDEELEEQPEVESNFTEFMLKFFEEENSMLREVKINSFDPESIRSRSFIFFFNLVVGGIEQNSLHKFRIFAKNTGSFTASHKEKLVAFSANDLIKKNSIMTCLDNKLVFSNYDPTYRMLVFDLESEYQLEYIETQSILSTQVLKSHNLLAHVYKRQHTEEVSFVLYKVTRNAVKQTIRNQRIEDWEEGSTFHLTELAPNIIGVWHITKSGQSQIFAFFEEGPILYAAAISQDVIVNDRSFFFNIKQDDLFNFASVTLEQPLVVNVNSSEYQKLTNFVSISGHVDDIIGENSFARILKPLREHLEKDASIINIGDAAGKKVSGTSRQFVVEGEQRNHYVVVTNGLIRPLEIQGLDESSCSEIVISETYLFCFWQSEAHFFLTRVDIISKKHTRYELSHGGYMTKVILENTVFTVLARIQHDGQYVAIYKIEKRGEKLSAKFIGKNKLSSDNLQIADFHISYKKDMDTVTALILDRMENFLHIFHGKSTMKMLPTLRKFYDLSKTGYHFTNITCANTELHDSELNLRCFMYSDAVFLQVEIDMLTKNLISDFTFDFRTIQVYKNALFQVSPNSFIDIVENHSSDLLFLRNSKSFDRKNTIFVYDLEFQHSFFKYTHPEDQEILVTGFNVDHSEFLIFYRLGAQLYMKSLLMSKYAIAFDKTRVDFAEPLKIKVKFPYHQPEHLSFEFFDSSLQKETKVKEILGTRNVILIVCSAIVGLATIAFAGVGLHFRNKRRDLEALIAAQNA